MRIDYLSGSALPSMRANSVHVMKMCSAFAHEGHSVTLHAYRRRGGDNVYAHYDVQPRFSIRALPSVPIPVAKRLSRTLAAGWRVRRGPAPDLFYGRDLYSLLAARNTGVPMIFEAHMPPGSAAQAYLTAKLLESERLVRLVVISDALGRRYAAQYPWLPPERLLVAHDGADDPAEPAGPVDWVWPGRAEALQVGYTGSLLRGKGAEIVVALARRLPQVDFHVLGGSPEEADRARQDYRGANLFFHGHVAHYRVAEYLSRVHVALLPMQRRVVITSGADIGEWTSPLKLFEYMARRLPIVASALPVIGEVLTDEVNALLVPPDDLAGWAAAVERLSQDEGLRARLGQRAYRDFRERHTWLQRSRRVLSGLHGSCGHRA